MSNSASGLLASYFRTRFPVWLVLSLPLVIVIPAIAVGRIATLGNGLVGWCLALLLFVEFRVWDDLADREQDCREEPSRVLCQATSLQPFYVVVLALLLVNFCLVIGKGDRLTVVAWLALHLFLVLWYAARRYLRLGPVGNYHAVLLKYPGCGFVVAAAFGAAPSSTLFAVLAVVYLGLCIAEVLHDRRLRRLNAAWICLGLEVTLLIGILAWWSAQVLSIGGE